ncbi:MAG: enoyl-CoA hydratase/isomerase family protein [Oscillospiraceae bacterium]|jgi:enoyl-CoA hydratase/carnithine racemase|nr:enoyl-CoA hydratase/isomerase family protein [Oscillospiraceae bacterium]
MPESKLNVLRPEELPGVLLLELDGAATLNALSAALLTALATELRAARRDDTVKAVLLTGAGEKAFSSGLSLNELDTMETDEDRRFFYNVNLEIREAIFALDKPVIAAVRGQCVGGGFEIALCCDLIYACEGASFLLPEARIGLTPGAGGAINLAAKLPLNRAMEILWFSERVGAEEMHRWGVVNKLIPENVYWEEVTKYVNKLLSKPQSAIRGIKQILTHTAVFGDQSESLKAERRLAVDTMDTDDFRAALAAFHNKSK